MPTTLAKIASAAHTVDGNSGLLPLGSSPAGNSDWNTLSLGVNVTAVTGTTPTLDLSVEWLVSDAIGAALGNATFDQTGGAVDDLWTLTSHGLEVNDQVQFTAVGTGAGGYAVDTTYHVTSVESANTFTLSATRGGAAIVGAADSVGTWTIAEKYAYVASSSAPDDFAATGSNTGFAQITAAGQVVETFRVRSDQYRIIYDLGGTTPSFTFEISEHVV